MADPGITFDGVWKKFRRGQRHDSLRDLIPDMVGGILRRASDERLGREEFWALRDVSFEIKPGEAVGIIGRNGAGKSTVLKVLTRILRPTLGRSEVRGRVGALIELAAGFHQDLTGRENVYLQGAIMGMKRAEIQRRFDEIVEFAGVGEFIDTQVKRYSSGMNARLGFAIAAHLDPDVLLIDEVLAVGDLNFQQKCYDRLRLFKKQGLAIGFVSHNMQAISLLSDRVLYLKPGSPPMSGSVGEMVSRYVSADAESSDDRVRVQDACLSLSGRRDGLRVPVAPGTRLGLRLNVEVLAPLPRCGLNLTVHRSDGLLVFASNSHMQAGGQMDVDAGDIFSVDVGLRANLLRGVYVVSGALLDRERLWPRAELGTLGSFVVEETTRWAGVAELEPEFSLARTGRSSGELGPSTEGKDYAPARTLQES